MAWISPAPLYGEDEEEAVRRLNYEALRLKDCLHDLRSTGPHDDKKRVEDTKGGLLADLYPWVLDDTSFQRWQQNPHSRLPWVEDDPGKGKTMLLCGILEVLRGALPRAGVLSYLFCQATDSRSNSATAVLRGLMYMLVNQQPLLAAYVREKYDYARRSLFKDANV